MEMKGIKKMEKDIELKESLEYRSQLNQAIEKATDDLVEAVWSRLSFKPEGIGAKAIEIYQGLVAEERLVQARRFKRLAGLILAMDADTEMLFGMIPMMFLWLRVHQYSDRLDKAERAKKEIQEAVKKLLVEDNLIEQFHTLPLRGRETYLKERVVLSEKFNHALYRRAFEEN